MGSPLRLVTVLAWINSGMRPAGLNNKKLVHIYICFANPKDFQGTTVGLIIYIFFQNNLTHLAHCFKRLLILSVQNQKGEVRRTAGRGFPPVAGLSQKWIDQQDQLTCQIYPPQVDQQIGPSILKANMKHVQLLEYPGLFPYQPAMLSELVQ